MPDHPVKVFVLAPRENWIVDRFVEEWYEANPDISTRNLAEADVIWIMADWCWNHLPVDLLARKKVVITVWHLVPDKFGEAAQREFAFRDQFVDIYHAPSMKSQEQIAGLTQKPTFHCLPWVNSDLWFPMTNKQELRQKFGISANAYLIGSFQRDTEGYDLRSPKMEKGPDRFCNAVKQFRRKMGDLIAYRGHPGAVEVLLGAWRRQYVMKRLDDLGIKYHYFERPSNEQLNEMYNALDLYVVGSRQEGGPQAIVECAATHTPVVSTDVGLASEILSPSSLFDPDQGRPATRAQPDIDYAYDRVGKLFTPEGFDPFRQFFQEIVS